MKNTQIIIVNTLAVVIIATLFFFALTFILFNFFKIETSLKDTWSTLGSFFGGITTLSAAYIASLLFNDWKEQHNKEIEIKFISKVLECFEQFDLKITKMFQFDYLTIDVALRHDIFIRECVALELDVRIIKVKYEDYHNYLGQSMPESHKDIFIILQRSLKRLKDTNDIVEKRRLIKYRIIHDLFEFNEQYEKNIRSILFKNLKALK